MRTFNRTIARTGVLQIDSVNVLQRAQYMPLYSRMGPYDIDLLRRASEQDPRRVVEYWAHVAAFMPVELWPHMQHRMRTYRDLGHAWTGLPERLELVDSLLAEITDRGASTPRDLDSGLPPKKVHWGWNWSDTKQALEYLFLAGRLAVAGRNQHFERLYDLPERVIPRAILDVPEPTAAESARELVRRAAMSHGVSTTKGLLDYYRMHQALARPAIRELVESGELLAVNVEGWPRPAYLHRDAAQPRGMNARTLLSPFDPVVWERDRTEHLFGFRYRIEIYVPEPQRVHGYYVLPFLLGDLLVGRVDLKADRKTRALLVLGAYAEDDAPTETADELAAELRLMATWLQLDDVVVGVRGDLAPALTSAVRREATA